MRLFLAAWPPEHVLATLRELPRKDRRGVRFVPEENWHVTLRFLGDASVDAVMASLDDAGLPTVTARLGPGVDMLGERLLVAPVHGVDDLAAAVRRATNGIGESDPKRFVGHLTLARLKPGADLPPAMGAPVSAEWTIDEVALVQSRLHPDGARYTTVATWR